MKIYVVCDLEGTAGVVDHRRQCWFDGEDYHQARRLATLELNALVEGALQGGATEVHAWDGHGNFPGGIDVEELHPECRLIMNGGDGGPPGVDRSYRALLFVGLHAMAGARQAVLAHSFEGSVAAVWLNGVPVGEIGVTCALFAHHGVPAVFLAGDRAAAEEIDRLAPGIETAIVKEGLSTVEPPFASPSVALSLSPSKARAVIREGARRALGRVDAMRPVRFDPPYTVRVRYYRREQADDAQQRPGTRRLDETTVERVQDEPGF